MNKFRTSIIRSRKVSSRAATCSNTNIMCALPAKVSRYTRVVCRIRSDGEAASGRDEARDAVNTVPAKSFTSSRKTASLESK